MIERTEPEVVSKAELARRLNRSKAAVAKYCRAGLPVRPDGLIDLAAAERWFRANVLSERSGSFAHDERVRTAKSADRSAKGKATTGKPAGKPADRADPAPGPGPGASIASLQRAKLR